MLTPDQLDHVYTEACRSMTALGADKTELFLGRLALLLMKEVGDSARILDAVAAARKSIETGEIRRAT